MRELKFRAWNGKEKQFAHWNINNDKWNVFTRLWAEIDGEMDDSQIAEDEQYTGLKDKNGKEIYEGDIVDCNDDGECIGVVEYDAPVFYLNVDATNWARMFLKGAPHQRVIGNIHENPELLGEEKE